MNRQKKKNPESAAASRKTRRRTVTVRPRCKLWLSSARTEGIFGDGKFRLLQAIDQKGSLTAATRLLGISYRKAWGDLQKAERCLGTTLIEKSRGGAAGGQTRLTEAGSRWLKNYSRFRKEIDSALQKSYEKCIASLL